MTTTIETLKAEWMAKKEVSDRLEATMWKTRKKADTDAFSASMRETWAARAALEKAETEQMGSEAAERVQIRRTIAHDEMSALARADQTADSHEEK